MRPRPPPSRQQDIFFYYKWPNIVISGGHMPWPRAGPAHTSWKYYERHHYTFSALLGFEFQKTRILSGAAKSVQILWIKFQTK